MLPDFNGTEKPEGSKKEETTIREQLVLDCLKEAAEEHGVLGDDGVFVGVHIDRWRPLFMERCQVNSATEEKRKSSRSSALSRAMKALCKEDGSGVIVQKNDMYRFSRRHSKFRYLYDPPKQKGRHTHHITSHFVTV